MAELGAVFSYGICTVKLGYKRLFASFSCQFRPHAPDMVCGSVCACYR